MLFFVTLFSIEAICINAFQIASIETYDNFFLLFTYQFLFLKQCIIKTPINSL